MLTALSCSRFAEHRCYVDSTSLSSWSSWNNHKNVTQVSPCTACRRTSPISSRLHINYLQSVLDSSTHGRRRDAMSSNFGPISDNAYCYMARRLLNGWTCLHGVLETEPALSRFSNALKIIAISSSFHIDLSLAAPLLDSGVSTRVV